MPKIRYSEMPPYLLWGPIMQDAIIGFIEKAGWTEGDQIGFWRHDDHEQDVGYLSAFQMTQDWLFPTPTEDEDDGKDSA